MGKEMTLEDLPYQNREPRVPDCGFASLSQSRILAQDDSQQVLGPAIMSGMVTNSNPSSLY
jgi:hypothetical protein